MTTQIADAIEAALDPKGVLVVVDAEHLCMSMRGVKKSGTSTVTSAVRGLFRSDTCHPLRGHAVRAGPLGGPVAAAPPWFTLGAMPDPTTADPTARTGPWSWGSST